MTTSVDAETSHSRSASKRRRIILYALIGATVAACSQSEYSTPGAVFTPSEAVVPAALGRSYRSRGDDPSQQMSFRLVPLAGDDRVFMLELIYPTWIDESLKRQLPALLPIRFIALGPTWHIADVGPMSDAQPERLYSVVGFWPNLMEVAQLREVPEQVVRKIAARHGLQSSGKPAPLDGAATGAALKGLFGELLAALPADAVGGVSDAVELPEAATASFVRNVTDRYLTPDRIATRQGGEYMLRYLDALDRSGEAWGTYGLARQRLAEGNTAEAARLAGRALAAGVARANFVLGALAQQGDGADHIRAARLFREAATAGETRAMLALHDALRSGRGVFRSETEADAMLRKAADGDLAAAQVKLGRRLSEGDGMEKDDAQAAKWFEKASGDAEALTLLAGLHATGRGVPRNENKASELLLTAARAGLPRAEYEYGERVLAGRGVKADREVGIQWLQLAAAHGDPQAKKALLQFQASRPQPCFTTGSYQCARTSDGRMLMRMPLGPGWFFEDGREAPAYAWPR